MKPTVFISYNWDSDSTADRVEKVLDPIAEVLRDKKTIAPWASIGDFMRRIRESDLAVIIISDKYLKSKACLTEVLELLKEKDWLEHTAFVVEGDAKKIYNASGQLDYVNYWIQKQKELQDKMEGTPPSLIDNQATQLKEIEIIQRQLNDFLKHVVDTNNPDIDEAIMAIEKRVEKLGNSLIENSANTFIENDKELIRFYVQCFDRPAFKDDIYQEGCMENFDKALEDTIIALNTGTLRTRDGSTIKKSEGKALIHNPSWRHRLDCITDELEDIRRRLAIAKERKLFTQHNSYEQGAPTWYFFDRSVAEWFNESREEILNTLSSICVEAGLAEIRFPRRRHKW